MLSEFARGHETDSGLDFAAREGGLLVVGRKFASLAKEVLWKVFLSTFPK